MFALIAAVCGAIGGFARELLGNKGIFAFPKWTEKNLALGGLVSVLVGAVAAVIGLPTYNVESPFWYVNAIVFGLGWSDVLANATTLLKEKVGSVD
ncbi:MAG: DUF4257 domain-containing protein [Thermoproteota archaeon]